MNRSRVNGIIAGALAGLAGAFAMNAFQRVAARAGGGREAHDATIGIPRTGRGPQPAQALGNASDDAATRVADAAMSVAGYSLTTARHKEMAGEFVHLAFGALSGAVYGAAVQLDARVRTGAGVPFGLAVWALADEGLVPALRLKRAWTESSPGLHAYSAASHVVYGATTEVVRGWLMRR